jgi:hypothetical protein
MGVSPLRGKPRPEQGQIDPSRPPAVGGG